MSMAGVLLQIIDHCQSILNPKDGGQSIKKDACMDSHHHKVFASPYPKRNLIIATEKKFFLSLNFLHKIFRR